MTDQPGWTVPGSQPPAGQSPAGQPPTAQPAGPLPPTRSPIPAMPPMPTPVMAPPPAGPPVLKPGIVPLRPLGLGEMYDGSFRALRANPRTMIGLTAVVMTIASLLNLAVTLASTRGIGDLFELTGPTQTTEPTQEEILQIFGALGAIGIAGLVTALIQTLAVAVLTGLLTVTVSEAVLGRRTALGQLWSRVSRRVLPLLGLTLLQMLAFGGIWMVGLGPGIGLVFVEPISGTILIVVGVLAAVAGSVLVWTKTALAGPSLVLEGQPVLGAWRRSWRITSGSFWRVLGIMLLTVVITAILSSVVAGPFQLVSLVMAFASPEDPAAAMGVAPLQLVLNTAGAILSSTIVYPFLAAVVTLLYVDLRMRREGLDVQLARQAYPAA